MAKEFLTAQLQGGLGNQLFILAAGLEQARRLGCPLYLDTSLNEAAQSWPIEVGKLEIDGMRLGAELPMRGNVPIFKKAIRKTVHPVFAEQSFNFDSKIFEVQPGSILKGYFQSSKYFPTVSGELYQAVAKAGESELPEAVVKKFRRTAFLAVHVRRGDYVSSTSANAVHGTTSASYFEGALNLLRNLTGIENAIVFSDDIAAAETELAGIRDLDFESAPRNLSSLATLRLMSFANGLVISNSTFSWWAAWLREKEAPASPIIAPRPWFSSISETADLLPSSWLTLGR